MSKSTNDFDGADCSTEAFDCQCSRMQRNEEKMVERRDLSPEAPETPEEEIEDLNRALSNSRSFLENLAVESESLRSRVEEIKFSFEREIDRLSAKKR